MGCRVFDLEKRVLVDPANGKEETLTASEFDLLKVFAEHPNKPLQRDWLLEVTAHRSCDERAKYDRTRQRPIIAIQFELAIHDPPPAFS
jgi:DNA-binding response OmpR family regulator